MSLKALGLLGVAAATLTASTFMTAGTADARPGFRGGYGGGFAGRGFGGGRGYYGGGYRRGGFGYGAAGLGAGLALGALAASAYPAYGYGYGYGGGYYPASYYGGGCYWQPRRVWGPYGWQMTRVQVCY